MPLEKMMTLFLDRHYPDASYEARPREHYHHLNITVYAADEYFRCHFCLLDENQKTFTAHCDARRVKSFAYAVGDRDELIDIKRDLFPLREMLNHLDECFESSENLEAFIADTASVDLFYDRLTFDSFTYGGAWTIEVNPMYDPPRADDFFLGMSRITMALNRKSGRFEIYNGLEQIRESEIDYTNGIVTANGSILFMVLNPSATFSVVESIAEDPGAGILTYEGEIASQLGATGSSDAAYCKFTITDVARLPRADVIVQLGGRTISAKTPLLLLHTGPEGFVHLSLREHRRRGALDEIARIVKERLQGDLAQFHLDFVNQIDRF